MNSLWDGFIAGVGGDRDALRNPDAVWGTLFRFGITMVQTDEPEALLRYRNAMTSNHARKKADDETNK